MLKCFIWLLLLSLALHTVLFNSWEVSLKSDTLSCHDYSSYMCWSYYCGIIKCVVNWELENQIRYSNCKPAPSLKLDSNCDYQSRGEAACSSCCMLKASILGNLKDFFLDLELCLLRVMTALADKAPSHIYKVFSKGLCILQAFNISQASIFKTSSTYISVPPEACILQKYWKLCIFTGFQL